MTVLFIFIVMCMRVVQSVYSKKISFLIPGGIFSYALYLVISMLMASGFSLITLAAAGDFSGVNAQAVIIAAFSGTFLALGSMCSLKALTGGTIVLNSIFGTAGLIVPCILGMFFFNESLTVLQMLCILAVLFSAVLLIDSSKKITGNFSKKTLFCLIGNFLTNGMVMFCQKLFGVLQPDGNVSFFSMLTFFIPALVLTAMLPIFAKKSEKTGKFPKKLILYISFLAFAVFVIQQLVTMLAPTMHSAVLFTIVNGGATVIAYIVGAIMYKEKITRKSAFGVLTGIVALILIKTF